MDIIWFVLIGVAAGAIAGRLMRGHGFGPLGNLAVGILGAVIGGMLFSLLRIEAVGLIGSLVTAVVGACLLLFVAGKIRK